MKTLLLSVLLSLAAISCSPSDDSPAPTPPVVKPAEPVEVSLLMKGRFYVGVPAGWQSPKNATAHIYFTPVVKTTSGGFILGQKFLAARIDNISATQIDVQLPALKGYKNQPLSPLVTINYNAASCPPPANGMAVHFWAMGSDGTKDYNLGSTSADQIQPNGSFSKTVEIKFSLE